MHLQLIIWTHQISYPVFLFHCCGVYCSWGLCPFNHGVLRYGLSPCLNHTPLMVLNSLERRRPRPSPSTVLRAAGSHWGRQGTLLSTDACSGVKSRAIRGDKHSRHLLKIIYTPCHPRTDCRRLCFTVASPASSFHQNETSFYTLGKMTAILDNTINLLI